MDAPAWMKQRARPEPATTPDLIYEHMETRSGGSLPIIHLPFDAGDRSNWQDRGAAFDYLGATRGEERRLLDCGPGDGWPSLPVAPYAAEVIGVKAAARRAHLGIVAERRRVPPGTGHRRR